MATLLAGVMVCGTLAACGGKTSEGQGDQGAGADSGAGDSEGGSADSGKGGEGKQVLSVTTWDNESTPQFQAVIDAYEEKNPNEIGRASCRERV